MKSPVGSTPVMHALYADGVIYFVAVVSLRICTSLTFVLADQSYWYLSPVAEYALTSTCLSRLFLHLRRVAKDRDHPNDSAFYPGSAVMFSSMALATPSIHLDTRKTEEEDHVLNWDVNEQPYSRGSRRLENEVELGSTSLPRQGRLSSTEPFS